MQELSPSLIALNDATAGALAPLPRTAHKHVIKCSLSDNGERFELQTYELTQMKHMTAETIESLEARNLLYYDEGERYRLRVSNRAPYCKWLDNMPGISAQPKDPDSFRSAPATDQTALMLSIAWGRDRLIASDDALIVLKGLLLRFQQELHYVQDQAAFKLDEVVPDMPESYSESSEYPLSPYQKMAFHMAYNREGAALFMEQGTGKTAVAVTVAYAEAKETDVYRCLVICPPAVRGNWAKEFLKFWDGETTSRITILRDGKMTRKRSLINGITKPDRESIQICIISTQTAVSDIAILCAVGWNRAIIDESHWMKSPTSARWQAFSQLREYCGRRMILSGTPIGNTLLDLWTQWEFLYEGASGFQKFKEFKEFYGRFRKIIVDSGKSNRVIEKLIGYSHMPFFQERLARLSFAISKKDAKLNLPDKVYDSWEVEMTPKQLEIYQEFGEQLVVEIELGMSTGEIRADHVLTKLLKLAQICNGYMTMPAIYDPATGAVVSERQVIDIVPFSENPKINDLREMITEKESKTIVFAIGKRDHYNIERMCRESNIKYCTYHGSTPKHMKENIEKIFNEDPETKVIVANPVSAGLGLTLLGYDPENPEEYDSDLDCDLMVWYSQSFSRIDRAQGEDRGNRRGSRVPITIRNLIVADTVDEEIRNRVASKMSMSAAIMDYVESVLKPSLGRITK